MSRLIKQRAPRLEFFSDAIFAIILTVMVLELHPPSGMSFQDLYPLAPLFLSYTLSYIYLIIYWNNHHHMMSTLAGPTAAVMWSNAHLLFWLSFIPFSTNWLGESHGAVIPAVVYGINLLLSGTAYFILQRSLVAAENDGLLAKALGRDMKGKLSLALYVLGILSAFISPAIAYVFYVAVAVIWVIPDQRIVALYKQEFSNSKEG